jgi:hypothetical protein
MMLLHLMGVLALVSTALALSSTAHIQPVSGAQAINRKGKIADDVRRRLSGKAQKKTGGALSHDHSSKADADTDTDNVRPSATAHIKPVSGPQAAKGKADDALRRLTGKARKEFDQLSSTARATAKGALSHAHISEADTDNVHFNAKGHLFFADPMPKHHANENLLKDEKEESADGERRRRSLSDAQPDRFLANGECSRTGGMGTAAVVEGGE